MGFHTALANAFFAHGKAVERERDEWKKAYYAIEACDCIPAPLSSRACGKCGRRGVVTEKTMHSIVIEANRTKAALEMLWKHHLLPLNDSQRAQVRDALGEKPKPTHDRCVPCEGSGGIKGRRCYACNGTGMRPRKSTLDV